MQTSAYNSPGLRAVLRASKACFGLCNIGTLSGSSQGSCTDCLGFMSTTGFSGFGVPSREFSNVATLVHPCTSQNCLDVSEFVFRIMGSLIWACEGPEVWSLPLAVTGTARNTRSSSSPVIKPL